MKKITNILKRCYNIIFLAMKLHSCITLHQRYFANLDIESMKKLDATRIKISICTPFSQLEKEIIQLDQAQGVV